MSKECAFCPSTAKLSGEHLFSKWMNAYVPGLKRFATANTETKALKITVSKTLDLTAKVVCERCNSSWMSDIENLHAKPNIGPLIEPTLGLSISQTAANSIALFAFKTAVVCDHMRRSHPFRFFPRHVRHQFKLTREIPATVQMWFAAFAWPGQGASLTSYHDSPDPYGFQLYVCSYLVGHFVFQLVASQKPVPWLIRPSETAFESLAVPFWPRIPDGFVWPARGGLTNAMEFRKFANRWTRVECTKIM